MKRFIWNLRYVWVASWYLRQSPHHSWSMAINADDYFNDDFTPRDALMDELTYWDGA